MPLSPCCSPAPSSTAYSRISIVNTRESDGAQSFGQTPLWISPCGHFLGGVIVSNP